MPNQSGRARVRRRVADYDRGRLYLRPLAMATVYAVANQKGGVGKTTTAVNLAACVAEAGCRTLLVDLDPQCNATVALGLPKDLEPNTYTCLLGRRRDRGRRDARRRSTRCRS